MPHPWSKFGLWLVLALLTVAAAGATVEPDPEPAILAHGPWPPATHPDPSNRGSSDPLAAALGARMFFDPDLSRRGDLSCAGCHRPDRWFTDGRRRAIGAGQLDRNTPTVVDVARNRWFGWDGASDNLWAQSLRPLIAAKEMNMTLATIGAYVRTNRGIACGLGRVFDIDVSEASDEALLVAVGKALAAYQETLVSPRTPFDEFRDALARGDEVAMSLYPSDARRGLALFVGRGRCNLCHFGPAFTNREFATAGVAHFTDDGVDPGRYGGILALRRSPYTLVGPYADRADAVDATSTRHVVLRQSTFGEFRVPGLRNVERTAPYMHDGSLATLADVVRHYSQLNEDRLHTHGAQLLRRLDLSDREVADLVAFLRSLTSSDPLPVAAADLPGDCG